MKLFYSYLLLFMGIMGFALPQKAMAQVITEDVALKFTLVVDDPSLCYLQNSDNERVELVKGENAFTLQLHKTTYSDGSTYAYSESLTLYIEDSKQNDYRITACDVEVGGNKIPFPGFYRSSTSMAINFDSEVMNGCKIYPTISNLNDARTATATVTVDDASKVELRCGNDGYVPVLTNGTNNIPFNPANEAEWTIGAKNYGEYLGGVTLNGEKVAEQYGMFRLTVAQGDVVDINTVANTEPVSVSFSFANADAEAAIKKVEVFNNSTYSRDDVENWKEGFEVAPRTQIYVTLDLNTYNLKSFTVNGEEQYPSYNDEVFFAPVENTVVAIDVEKYSVFSLNLTLTDPAHVSVGVAESQYSTPTELEGLVAGEQTVEISEKCKAMVVQKKDSFAIDKVTYIADGAEQDAQAGYGGSYTVPLAGVTAVTVVSHEIARNDVATLWINDVENIYMMYLNGVDDTSFFNTYAENDGVLVPVTGEQTFRFDASADNPFSLYFSPIDYSNPGYVTVNGEIAVPQYEGGTSYKLTIKNGDVIKLFAGEEVATAISTVQATADRNVVYNIHGVKVQKTNNLPAGLYIKNGRKIVVK